MNIPASTQARLPRYFRYLRELLIKGELRVSSNDLAKHLGLTASQVRADLSYTGSLGQQGYGYSIKRLYTSVSRTLGVGDKYRAIVICDTYCSLFDKALFEGRGVEFSALFTDVSEDDFSLAPVRNSGIAILPLSHLAIYCQNNKPEIAVILPISSDIQDMAQQLEENGVLGIWNFSQTEIKVNIPVKNAYLGDILMTLCCEMHNSDVKENSSK